MTGQDTLRPGRDHPHEPQEMDGCSTSEVTRQLGRDRGRSLVGLVESVGGRQPQRNGSDETDGVP